MADQGSLVRSILLKMMEYQDIVSLTYSIILDLEILLHGYCY